MLKKITVALILVCLSVTNVAKGEVVVDPASAPITLGRWHSDLWKAKAYSEANDIPLVYIWGSQLCTYSARLDQYIQTSTFTGWQDQRQLVMAYMKAPDGSITPEMNFARYGVNGTLYNFPFVEVYWQSKNTDPFNFTGRYSMGTDIQNAMAFINQIESYIGDYITPLPVPAELVSVEIVGVSTLSEGVSSSYACVAHYSDGTSANVIPTAWSDNSDFAIIDGSGTLTTSQVDSDQLCTLAASYTEGAITKSDTFDVLIQDDVPFVSIEGPGIVFEGLEAEYVCYASYSNRPVSIVTTQTVWSENSPYTEIDSNGILTVSSIPSDQQVEITAVYTEGTHVASNTYEVLIKNVDIVGSGTEQNPYLISNKWDLFYAGANVSDYDKYFRLVADIDLSGITNHTAIIASTASWWEPFTGIFDGAGHVISNMYIDAEGEGEVGLFGYNSGIITNLGVVSFSIENAIDGCGGICGINELGLIVDCLSSGSISGDSELGGICGVNEEGTILNCHAESHISGDGIIGGVCGLNDWNSRIEGCSSDSRIIGEFGVGGLCGVNADSVITNCFSKGVVFGVEGLGGLCGACEGGFIIGSHSMGLVGGIDSAGEYYEFTAVSSVGGLCGYIWDSAITDCYSGCTVFGEEGSGGLCGLADSAIIESSYSCGPVSGGFWTGGLCGYIWDSSVKESFSVSAVKGYSAIGGFCGINEGASEILDSYCLGDVQGAEGVGGFCAENSDSSISNCYSKGVVSDPGYYSRSNLGEFCGISSSADIIGQCYCPEGEFGDSYATELNATELLNSASYIGFDFAGNTQDGSEDIWTMPVNSTPLLSWQNGSEPGAEDIPHNVILPSNTVVVEGSSTTLSVPAQGDNLRYQWYADDGSGTPVPIAGAAGPSFTTPVLMEKTIFWVEVSNQYASYFNAVVVNVSHPVYDLSDLLRIGSNEGGWDDDSTYTLMNDIDLSGTNFSQAVIWNEFYGYFDGNGHVISNMSVVGVADDPTGLFAENYGTIKNLGVVNSNIENLFDNDAGLICGFNEGLIENCFVSGQVTAFGQTGGLCGFNSWGGIIRDCQSHCTVYGVYAGGLCGVNEEADITGCRSMGIVYGEYFAGGLCGDNYYSTITDSHSGCSVVGVSGDYTGGLCGYNENYSLIENCYSSGSVSGIMNVGGLCGGNEYDCEIRECFSVSSVQGEEAAGGLCGVNEDSSLIVDCYAQGNVDGVWGVGGFCCYNDESSAISNCYSTGFVSGQDEVRGFCGYSDGILTSCYYFQDDDRPWDSYAVPMDDSMILSAGSYYGFDFDSVTSDGIADTWKMFPGESPRLSWEDGSEPRPGDCPHDLIGPWTTAVVEGSSASLCVSAQGSNLMYQWYIEDEMGVPVVIPGATGASFTTPPVFRNSVFLVEVYNQHASVLSQPANVFIGHEIYTLDDLQKVGSGIDGWDLDDAYVLMNDIDASETVNWNYYEDYMTEQGFIPIGNSENPFTGIFEGGGHIVHDLVYSVIQLGVGRWDRFVWQYTGLIDKECRSW